MPLDQAQAAKVQAWIKAKAPTFRYPACGSTNFTVGDIVSAPVRTAGGVALGGPDVPMVQVICNNCVHVTLFAAVPMGLIK